MSGTLAIETPMPSEDSASLSDSNAAFESLSGLLSPQRTMWESAMTFIRRRHLRLGQCGQLHPRPCLPQKLRCRFGPLTHLGISFVGAVILPLGGPRIYGYLDASRGAGWLEFR